MPKRTSKSGSELFIVDNSDRETIRIMAAIDGIIDHHGGWPDAFVIEKDGDQ